MDLKILIVVVLGSLIFFLAYQCTRDERPNFDQIQAQERAARATEFNQKKEEKLRQRKEKAREKVKTVLGERPAPTDAVLETDDFKAVLTTRGAALKHFTLKNPQYLEAPRDWSTALRNADAPTYVPVDLVSTDAGKFELNAPLRYEIYEGLDELLPKVDYELVEQSDKHVVFRYAQAGLPVVILKKFELDPNQGAYQLWLTVQVTNIGSEKLQFRPAVTQVGFQHDSETEGGMFSKQPNLMNGICRHNDEVYREPWSGIEAPFSGIGNISFAGVETNYFISAMIPADETPVSCFVTAEKYRSQGAPAGGITKTEIRWSEVELDPGQSKTFKVKNYLGPKRFAMLRTVGHNLEEAVDFGDFLWPICRVLLSLLLFFQSVFANWGVAIIVLTVMVKVVLMPLTHQSFKSADRMKELKPQVDAINEKYKSDPQAKQKAVMGLYKQNKVNPLGGCLPMLLQMPIWISLYSTLRTSPELYRANFFGWINDLSSADPYFVTPIVMGALMFLQQRFTPTMGDAAQAKMMMYFMPVMFTGMMLFLPSGLTLYILVNTVLSIAHQVLIRRLRRK
jgi:YidC/Oxa1 family membrane protein insertase